VIRNKAVPGEWNAHPDPLRTINSAHEKTAQPVHWKFLCIPLCGYPCHVLRAAELCRQRGHILFYNVSCMKHMSAA
jgi:hypothetical protein